MLRVYDDGSTEDDTRKYLFSKESISLFEKWPADRGWRQAGLEAIRSRSTGPGLQGLVRVETIHKTHPGVGAAVCAAFRRFDAELSEVLNHAGMVYIQDDVLFTPNWLDCLLWTRAYLPQTKAPGLIGGMTLHAPATSAVSAVPVTSNEITAQCYYFTPAGVGALRELLDGLEHYAKGFDYALCKQLRQKQLATYVVRPAVCQHFGLISLVRPSWKWHREGWRGRTDPTCRGPYSLAPAIRSFC